MIPYTFTVTSSLIVTFFMAAMFFGGANIIGVFTHGWKALSLFIPSGVPVAIMPFLVLIEIISYFSRVISLSVRLFANMMSGHTLLKILLVFFWLFLKNLTNMLPLLETFVELLPWLIIIMVTLLECAIAYLQAYVFTVLIAIYLNDCINLH
jgi:ATP synthase subunit 6